MLNCSFLVQYHRSHRAVHKTLLQRFLHRHPEEALAHHQIFIWPLSGHQREARQDGSWRLERDDWRGMKCLFLSFSHISTLTLQTWQQFRAHGNWAKLASENIKIKRFTAWYRKTVRLSMTASTRFSWRYSRPVFCLYLIKLSNILQLLRLNLSFMQQNWL